jgi:DNA polymerase III subunit delta'
MSAPEPRANPALIGHAEAEATLLGALRAGRIHHAWLLSGPEGVGKATLAFRFARRLLAGGATGTLALDPAHPVFRRVAAGTHADLLTVERAWDEKRKRLRGEISVEDVRGVADFLRLTAAEGGWRVVVLDGVEHLNRNAANALLKVLEEPPARAVLLLVSASPGRLLPTIRSRCRRLPVGRLEEAEVARLLDTVLPEASGAERARLAAIAQGSPGRALRLADEDGAALAELAAGALRASPSLSARETLAIADQAARSDAAFSTFMDLLGEGLASAVRDDARGRAGESSLRSTAHPPSRPPSRPLAETVEVWQAILRIRDETERFNLDKRHAVASSLALLNGS